MSYLEALVRDAIEICSVPAPTGREGRRAALLATLLAEHGLAVEIDGIGNVLAELPGDPDRPRVAVVAHLDTVFPDEEPIEVRREGGFLHGPGIGDNSMGVAALVALARELPRTGLGPVLLVGSVGEEGNGDLRGARRFVADHGERIDAFVALEGAMRDRIVPAGIGAERLRFTLRGPGGHSWGDAGTPSTVPAAAALIEALYGIDAGGDPAASLNVGTVRAGHSINSIASDAVLDLDLRSLDADRVAELRRLALAAAARAVPEAGPITLEVETIGSRPAGDLDPGHGLLAHIREARREAGLSPAEERASSTDANIPLAEGIPACCIGVGHGQDAHRREERLALEGLEEGFAAVLGAVRRIAGDAGLRRSI